MIETLVRIRIGVAVRVNDSERRPSSRLPVICQSLFENEAASTGFRVGFRRIASLRDRTNVSSSRGLQPGRTAVSATSERDRDRKVSWLRERTKEILLKLSTVETGSTRTRKTRDLLWSVSHGRRRAWRPRLARKKLVHWSVVG